MTYLCDVCFIIYVESGAILIDREADDIAQTFARVLQLDER